MHQRELMVKNVFWPAGLSLLGYPGLQDIDPVYCMPTDVIQRLGLTKQFSVVPRAKQSTV